MIKTDDVRVCIVGLGYVGLPLALAFGKTNLTTCGFDINKKRIKELNNSLDSTNESSATEINTSKVTYSADPRIIKNSNFIIVAVPTPVTKSNQPDMTLLEKASHTVGENLTAGSIVVFESTVYPGATEEVCAGTLERSSGLKLGIDFKIGYSPERINPGDKEHTLEKVIKVVSGCDKNSTDTIAKIYSKICFAGVHVAPNIKTAEAAKVVENVQRDLNIALMNELSLIFHRMGIDTAEVLAAAGTKWNFLKFKPGLVGGHCIGVDPYYLVHKAEELGYHPQVISAGRRVNDYMPEFVALETLKGLVEAGKVIQKSKVLIIGLSFKENVRDLRNSKISDTITKLQSYGITIYGYDPIQNKNELINIFHIPIIGTLAGSFDAVIVAAAHNEFLEQENKILSLMHEIPVIVDIPNAFRKLKFNKNVIYKYL
jgi:UDP-N-acetyl-D-galactosamine dehydrogenase